MLKNSRDINPLVVLKSTVNMVNLDYITDFIKRSINDYKQFTKQIVVTGFHGLYYATQSEEYFQAGEDCDLWVPDSIAPVLIAKYRGMNGVMKTAGMDIMKDVFTRSEEYGWRHYFYGDTDKTLEHLKIELLKSYPKLKIVGTFSPPFRAVSDEENAEFVKNINEAKPDILWVGLGLPKQDLWIYRNKDKFQIPVAIGVGAAFGFFAKTTKRAPKIFIRCNLEWFYMLMRYPKRTFKRVVCDGSGFIWAVLKEELYNKK